MILNKHSVEKACSIAKEKHKWQYYGKYDYFDYHILGVVKNVEDMCESVNIGKNSLSYYKLIIIAYLHDIVEDTNYSLQEIGEEFGYDIEDCIRIITKAKDEDYLKYLERVMVNHYTNLVKQCDVSFNLSETIEVLKTEPNHKRMLHLKVKYEKAQEYLSGRNYK